MSKLTVAAAVATIVAAIAAVVTLVMVEQLFGSSGEVGEQCNFLI